jgi:hypothetical protein
MSAIPLYELDEVATKRDLVELRVEFLGALHNEIGTLRRETNAEFGSVRAELTALRDDINVRFQRILMVLVSGLFGIIATLVAVSFLA